MRYIIGHPSAASEPPGRPRRRRDGANDPPSVPSRRPSIDRRSCEIVVIVVVGGVGGGEGSEEERRRQGQLGWAADPHEDQLDDDDTFSA